MGERGAYPEGGRAARVRRGPSGSSVGRVDGATRPWDNRYMATAKKKTVTAPMFDMNGAQVGIGDRVEIGPHHDLWMMGAKYGEVRSTEGPDILVVKMDNARVKGMRRFVASGCKRIR